MGEAESAEIRRDAMEAENQRLSYERGLRQARHELSMAEMRMTRINGQMDVELGLLRRQIQQTSDDIEGTARKLAISREMEAVSQQYQNKMILAAQVVQRIRASLARLEANPPSDQPSREARR